MYLSHLTIFNFRQFGDGDERLELELSNGGWSQESSATLS